MRGRSRRSAGLRVANLTQPLQSAFGALDLVLDPVGNAALQDVRDVIVELAILAAQSGGGHHDRRLDLMQVQQ
jgi:hypothetical protein